MCGNDLSYAASKPQIATPCQLAVSFSMMSCQAHQFGAPDPSILSHQTEDKPLFARSPQRTPQRMAANRISHIDFSPSL